MNSIIYISEPSYGYYYEGENAFGGEPMRLNDVDYLNV